MASNSSGTTITKALALGATATFCFLGVLSSWEVLRNATKKKKKLKDNKHDIAENCQNVHSPCSEAYEIHQHIQETQRPATLLGIGVDQITQNALILSAPLDLNVNVHGTAFAGSLYSVAVLSAYYLARAYLQRQDLLNDFTLVAKSGSIQYKRPVRCSHIVATSVLPETHVLEAFTRQLVAILSQKEDVQSRKGKAVLTLCGTIARDPDGSSDKSKSPVACEFSVEVCAYR